MANDRQSLESLQNYYVRHGVLPSYAVIGRLVGLRSKSSVADLVGRLKRDGLLESTGDRRLKPGPHFFHRPAVESVPAGTPAGPADSAPEPVSIDRELVRDPSRTVLITVKGDSMEGAGIRDGDVVVVEKRPSAVAGDIVVAIVEDEFTLKRLAFERGRPVLRPENKGYPVIRPRGGLEIFGVVVGMFRRYR